MVNFVRAFVPRLSSVAAHWTPCVSTSDDLDDSRVWTPDCEESFTQIKEAVAAVPVLAKPAWSEP